MTDSSASSDLAPNHPPVAPRKASWTPDQLARIDYEWRRLQRNYAYHPVVRVIPLEGDPPAKYEIEYRLRTLGYNDAGEIDYLPSCSVTIDLPHAFPHAAPGVRPTTLLFHPNISIEANQVALIPDWTTGDTLEDVLVRVGMLLAFQTFDANTPWNPLAVQWVMDNGSYLPTDPAADLTPESGGGPAERIRRNGALTLKQLKHQVHEICVSMLDVGDPPTAADVRQFAQRTRMAVSLFTSSDLPAELTRPAAELESIAGQIPAAAPTFDSLRTLKANTATALTADADLSSAETNLGAQLAALEKMVSAAPSSDPYETMRQIPSTTDLQMALEVLRGLLSKADQKLTLVQQWLPSLSEPRKGPTFPPVLQDVIDEEAMRLTSSVLDARQKLAASARRAEPMIERTRREVAALEQLLQWKEFSQLTEKGHTLVMRAEGWGAAGVQAYFVTMGGQDYGPFEFEQQVDLGVATFALRSTGQRSIELMNLRTGRRVAAGEAGEIHFDVPGELAGEKYPALFHITARCDELWLQLDHIVRQTQALLLRATARAVETPSWCGRYTAALAAGATALGAEYRAAVDHWSALSTDLKAVGAFKERVATYYLLKRVAEHAPVHVKQQAAAAASDKQATARITEILARSSKDAASGQVIIPARLLKEYEERLDQRDDARETIAKLGKVLARAAQQVHTRGSSRVLSGSADWPGLRVLSPLSADVAQLAAEMTDDHLAADITALSGLLRVELLAPAGGSPPAITGAAAPHPRIAAKKGLRAPTPTTTPAPVPQPKPLVSAPPAERSRVAKQRGPAERPQIQPLAQSEPDVVQDPVTGVPVTHTAGVAEDGEAGHPEEASPEVEPIHEAVAGYAEQSSNEAGFADAHEFGVEPTEPALAGEWDFVDDTEQAGEEYEETSDHVFGEHATEPHPPEHS